MFRRYAAVVAAIRLANARQEPIGLPDDDTDWRGTNQTLADAVRGLGAGTHWGTSTDPVTGEISIIPIPKENT